MKYKIVMVEWTDAWSEDGWTPIAKLPAKKDDAKVISVGLLVMEDNDFYYLAGCVAGNDAACTIVIPKGMVSEFAEIVVKETTTYQNHRKKPNRR